MAQQMLSQRTFLGVAALGMAALVAGCDYTSIPAASPYNRGPEVTRRFILGETFELPQRDALIVYETWQTKRENCAWDVGSG